MGFVNEKNELFFVPNARHVVTFPRRYDFTPSHRLRGKRVEGWRWSHRCTLRLPATTSDAAAATAENPRPPAPPRLTPARGSPIARSGVKSISLHAFCATPAACSRRAAAATPDKIKLLLCAGVQLTYIYISRRLVIRISRRQRLVELDGRL